MKPTERKCPRIWRGLRSAAPARPSSAKPEHSFCKPEEDEPGDASVRFNATHQVGQGLTSEVLALRRGTKSEYSNQGSDGGGGDAFRVNMIRVHGKQEEERNEPKFGSSRAAPLQGADSGRPSGSGEVRGMGQRRKQKQESREVSYSTTSSEERYDRTNKRRDAHAKSSTLVPDVGFKSCYSDTSGPRYSSDEDGPVR